MSLTPEQLNAAWLYEAQLDRLRAELKALKERPWYDDYLNLQAEHTSAQEARERAEKCIVEMCGDSHGSYLTQLRDAYLRDNKGETNG